MGSSAASVVHLVRRPAQDETVENLRSLLREAEKGNLVGLVAAVHYGGQQFGYIGSGSLCSNPVLGVGALTMLRERFK